MQRGTGPGGMGKPDGVAQVSKTTIPRISCLRNFLPCSTKKYISVCDTNGKVGRKVQLQKQPLLASGKGAGLVIQALNVQLQAVSLCPEARHFISKCLFLNSNRGEMSTFKETCNIKCSLKVADKLAGFPLAH